MIVALTDLGRLGDVGVIESGDVKLPGEGVHCHLIVGTVEGGHWATLQSVHTLFFLATVCMTAVRNPMG